MRSLVIKTTMLSKLDSTGRDGGDGRDPELGSLSPKWISRLTRRVDLLALLAYLELSDLQFPPPYRELVSAINCTTHTNGKLLRHQSTESRRRRSCWCRLIENNRTQGDQPTTAMG